MGQVDVPKTGREVPFALQMDGSDVVNVQRNGGEGRAHARVAKLTKGEEDAHFWGGKNMIEACSSRDMRNIDGSDVCGCDFVTGREGHDDSGLSW